MLNRIHLHRRRSGSEEGSVILMVLLLTSVVLSLVPSTVTSSRQQVRISLESQASFQSELAAMSGMDFAMRQLRADSTWTPDGSSLQPYTGQHRFLVGPGTANFDPALRSFTVEGQFAQARTRLEFTVQVNNLTPPLQQQALAVLGEASEIHYTDIEGNALIADTDTMLLAYTPLPDSWEIGEWTDPDARTIGAYEFSDVALSSGELFKFSNEDYPLQGTETVIADVVHTPSYQLGAYLDYGTDRVLYDGITELKDVILEETAVFILENGATLTIEDSELRGGAVVYVDPNYDLSLGPLNTVFMKGNTVIGGGVNGASPNLALLAPASELTAPGCTQHPEVDGLTYVNTVYQWHQGKSTGQMLVHNQADGLGYSTITYDPDVAENPPLGFGFFTNSVSGLKLLGVREQYSSPVTE